MLQAHCAVYARFGRAGETVEDAERVLAIARELGDSRLAAVGHEALASAHFGQERFDQALAGYEKVLELDPHPAIEAHVRNNVAQVLRELGRLREAVEPQRRAVDLYRQVGELGFAAFAVGNLAELYLDLDRIEEAERNAHAAIELSVASGLVFSEAFGREILGRVLRSQQLDYGARQQWERSAELYAQVKSARVEEMRILINDLADGV
jgi:tetratricopeptide (TPR) repeat protein